MSVGGEGQLILAVVKSIVYQQHTKLEDILEKNADAIDWDTFLRFVEYHELTPACYCLLKKSSCVPSEILKILQGSFYSQQFHTQILWEAFLDVAHDLNNRGILFAPLKGVSFLCESYPQRIVRPMRDIDILIREQSLPEVEEVLLQKGYVKNLYGLKETYWRQNHYHMTFEKKYRGLSFPVVIEIHWALEYKTGRKLLPCLWERVAKKEIAHEVITILSREDTFFSLALHQRRFGKVLCLKNVCDGGQLIERGKQWFEWEYVFYEAKRCKLMACIYYMCAQLYLLCDMDIPARGSRQMRLSARKKRNINAFILDGIFSEKLLSRKRKIRELFLRSYFLLHDSFCVAAYKIGTLPQEQFAKFYNVAPYAWRTNLLYHLRIFYVLLTIIRRAISGT